MKIKYTDNPINYQISLDKFESKQLKYLITIDILKESIDSLENNSSHKTRKNSVLDNLDQDVKRQFKYLIEALSEAHHGDCVGLPSTCLKCMAEDILDIKSPIKSLNIFQKYTLLMIAKDAEIKNLDDIISNLNTKLITSSSTQEKVDLRILIEFLNKWRKKVIKSYFKQ